MRQTQPCEKIGRWATGRKTVLIALLLDLCVPGVWPPVPAGAQATLTILHSSEHHGTLEPIETGPHAGLGGVARRASLVQDVRKETEGVLLVDSGDLLIGTATSAMFRGEADIAAMNLMGYDALGVGNHDFDFGLDHLKRLRQQAKFPFLCTNLSPRQPGVCERVAMKTIGPLRIALIGLIGKGNYPETFNRNALHDLTFEDPIEAARSVVAELREQVELFVAITHEDTAEDLALARAVPGLDVIIGGHTPGFDGLIPPGQVNPVQGSVELAGAGPVFVKTHRQGRTLGRLDLLYHDRTIMRGEARNLVVDSHIPAAPRMMELVGNYVQRLNQETSRVIGKTPADLQGENAVIRTQETNLGDLLTDLARRESGAEVALINAGIIRGTIPAGPVTYRQLLEVLPFDSSLTLMTVTGKDLRAALENSVSRLPEASGRFLQVSGLRYTVAPTVRAGSRVTTVEVNGAPLDPQRRYSVVMTRFMAEGGDGYQMFQGIAKRRDYDTPLRDLLAAALAAGPSNIQRDSRIINVPVPK